MLNHGIWHTKLYFIGWSRPEMFYKKDVLRNFAKFTEADACNFILRNF